MTAIRGLALLGDSVWRMGRRRGEFWRDTSTASVDRIDTDDCGA